MIKNRNALCVLRFLFLYLVKMEFEPHASFAVFQGFDEDNGKCEAAHWRSGAPKSPKTSFQFKLFLSYAPFHEVSGK